MFTVKNGIYKSVTIDWANVTLPLKEGSPVSAAGVVANTANAIGIVPQTVSVLPVIPEIYVLVGGDVYRDEVEEAFGDDLEDAAVQAMDGIRFYGADGTPSASALPLVSSTDAGKVLKVDEDGNWVAAEGGGGVSYEVTCTHYYDDDEGDWVTTCDKTFEEISELLYDHDFTATLVGQPNFRYAGAGANYNIDYDGEGTHPIVLSFVKDFWNYQSTTLVYQMYGYFFTINPDNTYEVQQDTREYEAAQNP